MYFTISVSCEREQHYCTCGVKCTKNVRCGGGGGGGGVLKLSNDGRDANDFYECFFLSRILVLPLELC